MERFKEYIRSGGDAPAPERSEIETLVALYPWFTAARFVRGGDSLCAVLKTNRWISSLALKPIDAERLAEVTEGEIIDRFLRLGDYRIVVGSESGEGDEEEAVRIDAELGEEDDIVSEELAEVYLAQGMNDEAAAIYRKLSLLNPEKSVYFAEKIGKLNRK